MAAENSDAMTLEQFKVYSGKNGGGGGLELLWEGSKTFSWSQTTLDLGKTLSDYPLLFVKTRLSSQDETDPVDYIIVGTDGDIYGKSDRTFSVSGTSLQFSGVSTVVTKVYGLKSGGGGAVAPEQTYRLDNKGEFSYHEAGDVLVIANGTTQSERCLYQQDTEELVGDIYTADTVSDFPDFVQEVFASQPSTLAPPPTSDGYAWAIMPPCDCYVFYS